MLAAMSLDSMNLRSRNLEPELMDDPSLDQHELFRVLKDLHFLNKLSCSADKICQGIAELLKDKPHPEITVLDVGCGSGETFCDVITWLNLKGWKASGIGIDMNPTSINLANKNAHQKKLPIQFRATDAVLASSIEQFDIATSSLFLHHLSEEQVRRLFTSVRDNARIGMAMADLERSRSGYALTWLATRIFSRSRVVHHDGPQSVKAAFTRKELLELAQTAGMKNITITRRYPRQLLALWKQSYET